MTLKDLKNLKYDRRKIIGRYYKLKVIYKFTNRINGKVYIGLTIDLSGRLTQHFRGCSKANPEYLIHKAIKKHGLRNFDFEVIETVNTIEELNRREQYWINYYNSNYRKCGYNLTIGGRNPGPTEETKRKLRRFAKNKKKVYIYDLQGNFVRSYESISECARQLKARKRAIFRSISAGFLIFGKFLAKTKYSDKIAPHEYIKYKEAGKRRRGKNYNPNTFIWRLIDLKKNITFEEGGIHRLSIKSGHNEDIIRSIAYNRPYYQEYKKFIIIEKLQKQIK